MKNAFKLPTLPLVVKNILKKCKISARLLFLWEKLDIKKIRQRLIKLAPVKYPLCILARGRFPHKKT